MERRIDEVTQMHEDQDPPCVEKEEYGWPTRVLRRSTPESAAVRIVQKTEQDRPSGPSKREESNSEPEVHLEHGSDVQPVGLEMDDEDEGDFVDALEEVMSPSEYDDGDEYFDAISLDDDSVCGYPPNEILEEDDDEVPVQDWPCTPLRKLELEFERCMKMNAEDLDSEPTIYIHEGSELLSQLRDQLVLLPELKDLSPSCDIETADVGEPGITTPDEEHKMRNILSIIVVSSWVTAMLPLPRLEESYVIWMLGMERLIDDLLIGFESAMWFMSLDMASGFWAIRMTERAKLISAFVCPFRHFQWVCMPFGLKNAPLVYQAVINNCLWGFVRLPPEEEAEVDQDVLDFLLLECPRGCVTEEKVPALIDTMTHGTCPRTQLLHR
ncbi:hypothetical protein PF005_g24369 [Phytophthora fragariae]|uniref:Reverse transcriptase domain-containing protein n=1 Tax=Phytophthora fragariae TaxID=53985 RepID=A0A6A3RDT6_9STRA|nr:hypothetical protein PF003_g3922 [Phytophthora fragariae]KAE8923351.1 hypothetical protein PF009_g26400 [Phytophthora fragariae]KAE8975511.1 hypothetical protein PF011_g24434 [Phytophthora fragariae]KAE9075872.1 hypothetical protein PF010_g24131 [Phytophthora fragariae]KAE9077036.1 hypothetical protein PF007_g24399 [Phytophthora fragariae]